MTWWSNGAWGRQEGDRCPNGGRSRLLEEEGGGPQAQLLLCARAAAPLARAPWSLYTKCCL